MTTDNSPPFENVSCLHCGEPLHFDRGKGWLHPDGSLIKQRLKITERGPGGDKGTLVDDHVALPDYGPGGV